MSVHWFNEIEAADITVVGGKGANLGQLTRAGFPVPPGFCVAATAYRRHIAGNNLGPAIAAVLARIETGNVAELERATQQIRTLIDSAPMSDDVATTVRRAYAILAEGGHDRVAIRSSATAEDLPEASFAGQQETFLGITGVDEVLSHVRKAWASLWTSRAVAYRQRQGFDHSQVALAVVVQAMVEPDTAGVLFTTDPLGMKQDAMLVNAAYGLGESVVSGRVTPDTYRLARSRDLVVLHRQLGAKETRIRSALGSGSVIEPVPEADRSRYCLDDAALKQLVALGLMVEAFYGSPQDIEWAMIGSRLYLLQARPITTLATTPEHGRRVPKRGRLEHKLLDSLVEHCPEAPCPLDASSLQDFLDTKRAGLMDLGLTTALGQEVLRVDSNGIATIGSFGARPTWRMLGVPFKLASWLRSDPPDWAQRHLPWLEDQLAALRGVDTASLTAPELGRHIRRAVNLAVTLGQVRFKEYVFPMVVMGGLLRRSISRIPGMVDVVEFDLLGDLPYKTAVIDEALHLLAATVSGDPELKRAFALPLPALRPALEELESGRAFLADVGQFLARHGARTVKAYLPFSSRSWSEEPDSLLAIVAAIVRSGETAGAKRSASGERYRQLRQRIETSLPGGRRQRFLRLLKRFRTAHVGREGSLYGIEQAYVEARRCVREAARRLTERGALPAEVDVLYLTLPELWGALDGQLPVQAARDLVVARRRSRPKAIASWLTEVSGERVHTKGDNLLTGLPGSPGLATGSVRVISGPAEFGKLEPGDVLVCAYTDPVWTPLFSLAAAVISDTGGPLSHAAIVAREYGIPAVLGTQGATALLKDGDRVTVDGNSGVVSRVTAG